MDYKKIINTIDSVLNNVDLFTTSKYLAFSNSLQRIKERTKDRNIYLGIVGEFASGKSTLINALIGADFFITNALQGTTTVITKLAYSDTINFVLNFKSGKVLSFKRHENLLLEWYLPNEYIELSGTDKFLMKLKCFFGLNRFDEYFHKLFEIITTSNKISAELNDVIVYYPSSILQDGLVIVDTPGTDSLNPEHNLITQRAIKNVCDLSLVVVPATTPLTKTLVDFLEDNLRENVQKCKFVITKIELLRKEIERTHTINGISKRIVQLLNVEDPIVIAAPTLASLEYRGIIDKSEPLDYLSVETKEKMTNTFLADIAKMKDEIHKHKEDTIHDRIMSLVSSLSKEIKDELETQSNILKKEIEQTRLMKAKPLSEFMSEFYETNKIYELSYIEARISNRISSEHENFKAYVNRSINDASTKNDAQNTMSDSSTINYGNSCFNSCYKTFSDILDETRESFENNFKYFRDQFVESYGIQAVDFSYELNNDPSWKRKFNFNYDKSNLTTFAVLRFFKSLKSVKEQMINDVNPKIKDAFAKIESYYLKKARKAYTDLSKQMEKVKRIFVSKYQKVIDQRISESNKKEHLLQERINRLREDLSIIAAIKI